MIPVHEQILNNSGVIDISGQEDGPVTITVMGDLAFHDQSPDSFTVEDSRFPLRNVFRHWKDQDLVIGNLESVLIPPNFSRKNDGKARLAGDLAILPGIRNAGINALTLANNHILDAGQTGLGSCLAGLSDYGYHPIGAGVDSHQARIPAEFKIQNRRVLVFAYSYGQGQIATTDKSGCNEAKLNQISRDIQEFKESGDILIVCLHMDAEFQPLPAPDRVNLCRRLSQLGVQIVLCHHPHVPQGIEVIDGTLIAYSLGNYLFSPLPYILANSDESHLTFHLNITVDSSGPCRAEVVPVTIDENGHPDIASGAQKSEILKLVAERSRMVLDSGAVKENYRQMTREYTRDIVKNLYWALGEKDWPRIRSTIRAHQETPVKRDWIKDALFTKILPWR